MSRTPRSIPDYLYRHIRPGVSVPAAAAELMRHDMQLFIHLLLNDSQYLRPNEISEIVLSAYKKLGYNFFPCLSELVKRNKLNIAAGIPPVFDIDYVDERNDENIFLLAIEKDDMDTLQLLINAGVNIEWGVFNGELPLLLYAIQQGKDEAVLRMIKGGANLDVRNANGETPLMAALAENKEDIAFYIARELKNKVTFQTNDTGDDAVTYAQMHHNRRFLAAFLKGDPDDYARAVNSKKLLNLLYSQDDAPSSAKINIELLKEFLSYQGRHHHNFDDLNYFSKILNDIDNKQVKLGNGRIDIIDLPFPDHQAFITIEYDDNNVPVKLSYDDGNLPLSEIDENGYGFGEVSFAIKQQARGANLTNLIADTFKNNADKISTPRGLNIIELKKTLRKFVDVDAKGLPEVTGGNILTRPQDRGNCSIKSLFVLFRAIMKKLDPTLQFEVKNAQGKLVPGGNGYELYKKFRNFIIDKCLNNIFEIGKNEGESRSNSVYNVVLASLKSSLLQSASKKDNGQTFRTIVQALRDRGFSDSKIAQIKSLDAKNIFKVALQSRKVVHAASWCAAHLKSDEIPFKEMFEANDPEVIGVFLRKFSERTLPINGTTAVNFTFEAALHNANETAVRMIDLGFDVASQNSEGTDFLTYIFKHNPKLLLTLIQQNKIQTDEEFLTRIVKGAAIYMDRSGMPQPHVITYQELMKEGYYQLRKLERAPDLLLEEIAKDFKRKPATRDFARDFMDKINEWEKDDGIKIRGKMKVGDIIRTPTGGHLFYV